MDNSFDTLIRERRSIRSYRCVVVFIGWLKSDSVDEDTIKRIVEKINLCPTAGNQQVVACFHVHSLVVSCLCCGKQSTD